MQIGSRGRGRPTRGRGKPIAMPSTDNSLPVPVKQGLQHRADPYVIVDSTHLCGYPDCTKRFRFKHDLLRHQTKMHGRQPGRRHTSMDGDDPPADDVNNSDKFVIVESMHICGYPDCSRQFRFKHDLLRHQTKLHGRQPVRKHTSVGNDRMAEESAYDDVQGYSDE